MSSIYPPYGSAPVQLCQRCGRPLPPNEVHCKNCGLVNTPAQSNTAFAQSPSNISWGGTPPPIPPGRDQPGGQPWIQTPVHPPPDLNKLSAHLINTRAVPITPLAHLATSRTQTTCTVYHHNSNPCIIIPPSSHLHENTGLNNHIVSSRPVLPNLPP